MEILGPGVCHRGCQLRDGPEARLKTHHHPAGQSALRTSPREYRVPVETAGPPTYRKPRPEDRGFRGSEKLFGNFRHSAGEDRGYYSHGKKSEPDIVDHNDSLTVKFYDKSVNYKHKRDKIQNLPL